LAFRCLCGSDLAEQKGLILLRSWLSPAQARQFDEYYYFDVIGSDTNALYRIHYGRQLNVARFDAAGRQTQRLCFGPVGALATGDIVLAQKIALETMEMSTLAKANVRPPGHIAVQFAATPEQQRRLYALQTVMILIVAIAAISWFFLLVPDALRLIN
jgi:hypothetical protein